MSVLTLPAGRQLAGRLEDFRIVQGLGKDLPIGRQAQSTARFNVDTQGRVVFRFALNAERLSSAC